MSLRLRILLLIAAVNVGVLLLVIALGLQAAERAAPVGPQALLEAWTAAQTADLEAHQPWRYLRYVLRQPAGGDALELAVPADAEEEAREMQQRLLARLRDGQPGVQVNPAGLTFVTTSTGAEFPAFYVAFNDLARYEALGSLRRIYVVLCVGTVLLIVATYLVLRRVVLRPVERLVEASQAVAEGRLPPQVQRPRGETEVAHLVDNFNKMAREVAEYQQHLEERVLDALHRAKAAESRLVVAQRLAATGTLAAGFAHEINNPVGGVTNAVRKLREGGLSKERAQEYFELALDGLNRIRVIVERILHFTPQRQEPSDVDVADVCRRAASLAQHRAERRGIRLDVDAGEPVSGIVGDRQELIQAVLNLILNAIDAVVARGQASDGLVRVQARRTGPEVRIDVSDNGIGMDDQTRARCVDLFFSTKPEGEGTGLGLAIVQHIVTDHGGTMDIESRPDEGTTVRLRLPVVEGA